MTNNNVAKQVLQDRLDKSITSLERANETPTASDPACSVREPIVEGMTTLLHIKRVEMSQEEHAKNSIKFGNVTISGTLAILTVGIVYTLLKLHGVI